MEFYPMWPTNSTSEEKILEDGVEIIYESEDVEERQHIIQFLRTHFGFDDLSSFEHVSFEHDARHPICYLDGDKASFAELATMDEVSFEEVDEVIICFTHELQPLFRAYKNHLDNDHTVEFEEFREFYTAIEKIIFGERARPN